MRSFWPDSGSFTPRSSIISSSSSDDISATSQSKLFSLLFSLNLEWRSVCLNDLAVAPSPSLPFSSFTSIVSVFGCCCTVAFVRSGSDESECKSCRVDDCSPMDASICSVWSPLIFFVLLAR
ncbi:hypothetical protein CsSME_00051517 [Camellia sinensis var. sinensis]